MTCLLFRNLFPYGLEGNNPAGAEKLRSRAERAEEELRVQDSGLRKVLLGVLEVEAEVPKLPVEVGSEAPVGESPAPRRVRVFVVLGLGQRPVPRGIVRIHDLDARQRFAVAEVRNGEEVRSSRPENAADLSVRPGRHAD